MCSKMPNSAKFFVYVVSINPFLQINIRTINEFGHASGHFECNRQWGMRLLISGSLQPDASRLSSVHFYVYAYSHLAASTNFRQPAKMNKLVIGVEKALG